MCVHRCVGLASTSKYVLGVPRKWNIFHVYVLVCAWMRLNIDFHYGRSPGDDHRWRTEEVVLYRGQPPSHQPLHAVAAGASAV